METILQQIVNSLSIGAIYAMVAVGLTLIFGVLEVLNFAHGEFFMLGGFVLFIIFGQLGVPYLAAVPVVVLIMALAGWIMRAGLDLRPGRSFETMILATLGVSVVLQNAALAIWGVHPRSVRTEFTDTTRSIFGAAITDQRLLVLAVALVVFVFLDWFIRSTKTGTAMRAVAQNPEAAAVVGIDIVKISSFTFAAGIGLTAFSGTLVAPMIFINPLMGISYLMRSFVVITMAGRGNMRGAIISAFALAIVEGLGQQYFGLAFKDILVFGVLIIVLTVKPEGLFGRKAGLV